jgi:hypothetical protein
MIYFMQPVAGGPVKIGCSDDVERRQRQLERDYGRPLVLLATMEGGRQEETEIHGRFAHLRFGNREQFRPAPELMEFIERPVIAGANPDSVEVIPVSLGGRPVRLDLTHEDHERLERCARRYGLSKSSYVRIALFERMESDEGGKGGAR